MRPTRAQLEQPADIVGPRLLGSMLCRRGADGGVSRWPITEVEAYLGPEDLACHAAKGRTQRTEVMFGPAGHWYVYLCYGVHWLANLVTGPVGHPAAVLLRGAGPVAGPGRLTRALGIDGTHQGQPARESAGLWIELRGPVDAAEIRCGPRVGVDYAGEWWAGRPLRYIWTREWAGRPRKTS